MVAIAKYVCTEGADGRRVYRSDDCDFRERMRIGGKWIDRSKSKSGHNSKRARSKIRVVTKLEFHRQRRKEPADSAPHT